MQCPDCLEIDVIICEVCGEGIECGCCGCSVEPEDDEVAAGAINYGVVP